MKYNPGFIKALRSLWSTVKVQSCADGTLHIYPRWRKFYKRPGVITRMHAAYLLQQDMSRRLRRPK